MPSQCFVINNITQGSVRRTILFKSFTNDMNDELTNLQILLIWAGGWVACWTFSLERSWENWQKFNKEKCKVSHLGLNSPTCQYRVEASNPSRRTWMPSWLSINQMFSLQIKWTVSWAALGEAWPADLGKSYVFLALMKPQLYLFLRPWAQQRCWETGGSSGGLPRGQHETTKSGERLGGWNCLVWQKKKEGKGRFNISLQLHEG